MQKNTPEKSSIMIVTGEASGDYHGSNLVKAILQSNSSISFFGMGGKELENIGVEMIFDAKKVAVMGLTEVLSNLKDIRKALKILGDALASRKPDLLILVDFADFNLRLAKKAKKNGIPVFYYITPKVWVWRKNRAKTISKLVDTAGVILPFEEPFLRKYGVKAHYVGNPTYDSLQVKFDRRTFCQKYGLDENKKIVGILPGSRKSEIQFLLPIFLESARLLQEESSEDLSFVLPQASTLKVKDLEDAGIRQYKERIKVLIIEEDRYEMMQACSCVIAASGTVTLELAILNIPMIVAYKFALPTYYLGKMLINIPYFSLVNIIADRPVVKELLQHEVTPEAISKELESLLFEDSRIKEMKKDFSEVRKLLGEKGCAGKAAELALMTSNIQ